MKRREFNHPIRFRLCHNGRLLEWILCYFYSSLKYLLKATSRGGLSTILPYVSSLLPIFAAHFCCPFLLTLFQKIARVVEIEKYYTRMLWQKMLRTQPTASYIPSGCMTAFGRVLRKNGKVCEVLLVRPRKILQVEYTFSDKVLVGKFSVISCSRQGRHEEAVKTWN